MEDVRRTLALGVVEVRRVARDGEVAGARDPGEERRVPRRHVGPLRPFPPVHVAVGAGVGVVRRAVLDRERVVVPRRAELEVPAGPLARQPLPLPPELDLVPVAVLVVHLVVAQLVREPRGRRAPVRPGEDPSQAGGEVRERQRGPRVRGGGEPRLEEEEVEDRGLERAARPGDAVREPRRAPGRGVRLDPAQRLGPARAPRGAVADAERTKDLDEVRRPVDLPVAVPRGQVDGDAFGRRRDRHRADRVEEGGDELVPEGISVPAHLRAVDRRIGLPRRLEGEEELRGETERLRSVLEPLRDEPARGVGPQGTVEDVEPGARHVPQLPGQLAPRVVGRIERHRHQAEVPHVGRVVVVHGPAGLRRAVEEDGVVHDALRQRVVVPRDRRVRVLRRPAEEDGPDLRLVLGREVRVDPVDGQGEPLAVPARPVPRRELRVPVRLSFGGTRQRLLDDVHQERPRPPRPVGAFGLGADERQEGAELGVGLRRVLHPADGPVLLVASRHETGVDLRLRRGRERRDSVGPERVRGARPRAQARQVLRRDPEPGVARHRRRRSVRGGEKARRDREGNGEGSQEEARPPNQPVLHGGERLSRRGGLSGPARKGAAERTGAGSGQARSPAPLHRAEARPQKGVASWYVPSFDTLFTSTP